MIFTSTAVPYVGSPALVTPFSFILWFASLVASLRASSSNGSITFLVEVTEIALRFFEPITAPTPPRPAALSLSFIIAAISDCLSPAGPILSTEHFGCLSFRRSSTSSEVFPHMSSAGRISTFSSTILRYTGFSDFPSTIIASQPAYLRCAPHCPPEFELAIMLFRGDLVTTM